MEWTVKIKEGGEGERGEKAGRRQQLVSQRESGEPFIIITTNSTFPRRGM
jgi:hypothetical protein